jgi:hypothetical protein
MKSNLQYREDLRSRDVRARTRTAAKMQEKNAGGDCVAAFEQEV